MRYRHTGSTDMIVVTVIIKVLRFKFELLLPELLK